MNNMNAMAAGRDQTINVLWGMAADSDGLELEAAQQAQIVQQLRSLADSIERAPQNVVGLVLIAGEKIFGDQKGVLSSVAIAGISSAIAAAFCIFEETGRGAMNKMLPHVLVRVINDAIDDEGTTTEDLEVN